MRLFTLAIISIIACSACVSSRQYGNFLPKGTMGQEDLAEDVVRKMRSLLPPAQTTLRDSRPQDPFGIALVQMLRTSGYSLVIPDTKEKSNSPALQLRYVLDKQSDANVYLIVVNVGPITLSRPYSLDDSGIFRAVGRWVMTDVSRPADPSSAS